MEGNQMKMREALIKIRDTIMNGGFDGLSPAHFVNICDAALSAPPRQCDVGTPEDQKKRMLEYCKTHKNKDGIIICADCPMHGANWTWCPLEWAQTPYAEEGAGE